MKNFLQVLAVTLLALALIFSLGVTKSTKYAWLGVTGQTVDTDLADAFDLSFERGAIVNQILRKSPARDAGLEEGDIIIDFDGEAVFGWDDLIDILETHDPGDVVKVTVMREDNELEFEVTLEGKPRHYRSKYRSYTYHDDDHKYIRIPDIPPIPPIPAIPNLSQHFYIGGDRWGTYIGVRLSDLSDQLGDYFGVRKGRGALIVEVLEDSPAEEAGLKAGDVIVSADNEEIFDAEDVTEIVGDMDEGDKLSITVLRDKSEQTFEVVVDERDGRYRDQFKWVGPDIDIRIPNMSGIRHGVYFDDLEDFYFDSDEFEEAMEEFEDEMEELEEELRDMRYEAREDLREELEELEEELGRLKDKLD